MSVALLMTAASIAIDVIDRGEKIVKLLRLLKKHFGRSEGVRAIANTVLLWFSGSRDILASVRLPKEASGSLECFNVREFVNNPGKLKPGTIVEVEGVFSRFFPLAVDAEPTKLIVDLKKRMRELHKRLEALLSEIDRQKIRLYPQDFQLLLNFLEFGDEFRFRTTATIRDLPLKKGGCYYFISALYPNRATVNLGVVPVIIVSSSPAEPAYHTFYARVRGRVEELEGAERVKPIIVEGWDGVEKLDRDAVLYLSQWALVKAPDGSVFPVVPRCDLASEESYQAARRFIASIVKDESRLQGERLRIIAESDMVSPIGETPKEKAIEELMKYLEKKSSP